MPECQAGYFFAAIPATLKLDKLASGIPNAIASHF
jgi:hypothetical protein